MSQQSTDTVLMIRPVQFKLNEQTSINNYYQKHIDGLSALEIQQKALKEFDDFVKKLESYGIQVIVVDDTESPETPDSIFPNNWISFHDDGRVGIYPMYAENRRQERRSDIIEKIRRTHKVNALVDFTEFEDSNQFLEGTGSMILDRASKIAYAALSERTNIKPLNDFCKTFDYQAVTFIANQTVGNKRLPIYHTNVMMCIADEFAILCADSIDDPTERKRLIDKIESTGKEIFYITEEQKISFAGNMLQVRSIDNTPHLVMSEAAFTCLTNEQKQNIEQYCSIISSPLYTIETLGGGSARCMMAEIFLPKR